MLETLPSQPPGRSSITMKTLPVSILPRVLILSGFLLGLVVVSGCRTMEGAGKDIERAGESIQKSAK